MKNSFGLLAFLAMSAFQLSSADICVRMVTGSSFNGDRAGGFVEVNVDSGDGLKTVVPLVRHQPVNSIVLDKCYNKIMEFTIQNKAKRPWAGTIMFNVDGTGYKPGTCITGCVNPGSSTQSIGVDPKVSSFGKNLQSLCNCGHLCMIKPPFITKGECCSFNEANHCGSDLVCNYDEWHCLDACNGDWRVPDEVVPGCCSNNWADCFSSVGDRCHSPRICEETCKGNWIDPSFLDKSYCCSHNYRDCHYSDGDYCQSENICLSGVCGFPSKWIKKGLSKDTCFALFDECTDKPFQCCDRDLICSADEDSNYRICIEDRAY